MATAASTSKAIAQPGTPSLWLGDGLLVVRTGSVLLVLLLVLWIAGLLTKCLVTGLEEDLLVVAVCFG